ncbi:hypothetical protein SUGI_0071370 [Cryptomeria japonica]|nr:hypothetical protein SUGI_0071370 [Cryptomeria japonica]
MHGENCCYSDVLRVFPPTWRSPSCGLWNCTHLEKPLLACGVYQAAHSAGHHNSSARGFFDVYQAAHSVGHRNSSGRGFSDVYQAAHFAGHFNSSAIGFSDVYQVAHFAGHCNCSARDFGNGNGYGDMCAQGGTKEFLATMLPLDVASIQ